MPNIRGKSVRPCVSHVVQGLLHGLFWPIRVLGHFGELQLDITLSLHCSLNYICALLVPEDHLNLFPPYNELYVCALCFHIYLP
jgi:hypothetical protein